MGIPHSRPTGRKEPIMRHAPVLTTVMILSLALTPFTPTTRGGEKPAIPSTRPTTRPVKEIHIDMDKAVEVALP
jgi:hypothetical protein